ncbi:MAG: hypothetical protein O3C28_05490 [Proteobacteria bacterium]|nr:hypothetical protein [Pseudomonadota bacterium]
MGIYPTLRRLLEAAILSALAGGTAYGLTVWLAPPSVSAFLVAIIVAAITALAFATPSAALGAFGRSKESPWSPPETYYDLDYSLKKNSSWED